MTVNSNLILNNLELKMLAKDQLRGKWRLTVLLCLVYTILANIPIINPIFIFPLTLGLTSCFIKLTRGEPFKLENLFSVSKNLGSTFILLILLLILMAFFMIIISFASLWSLFLIVPGIIAYLMYSMIFYVLYDNPDIGAIEALNRSKKMMHGYKWKLFCLHFSFIYWILLSILTCGIGFLWLIPYMGVAQANFYENLKDSLVYSCAI
jgi:uncharacterized membrane protein